MAFRRQVKNFVRNYSDAEIKVREATSNDPWGPSSSLMLAISDLTFNMISLSEIMNMLWQRLSDHGKNWRHVYKSLTLMDYLIKHGSKKVIQHCREGFCKLQMLKDFQHIDKAGKDQGYYIREKSKQVIKLLMDEKLLYKEREVACQTRRRTSSSMTDNSSLASASAPTPEIPASEKKHNLLMVARLHNKKNASKAGLKQEQCQDIESPAGTTLSQEAVPLKMKACKSTEDLILFYDEDPKPLLPTIPPSVLSSTWLSEGRTEVCKLWGADAVPILSEKSPTLQTNVSLDERPDNAISNTVTENPLQTPQEKQAAAKSSETWTILPASCSSGKEEFIGPDLRILKSDSTCNNQSSVETLYVSPSFNTFSPAKETVSNEELQKPAQSSIIQKDGANLGTLTVRVSTASEGTSSFSTLSVLSPDSAPPEKSARRSLPILAGSSFWTLSHQQSSSASPKHRDKAARVPHPFTPSSPLSSNEVEFNSFSLLEYLPDNSDSAEKKTAPIPSRNWVSFSTQTAHCVPAVSSSSFQTPGGSPEDLEASNSIKVLLGEVKSAIVQLHEDLTLAIQELSVIASHLVSMSGGSPHVSNSLQDPQSSEGSSDHIESSQ